MYWYQCPFPPSLVGHFFGASQWSGIPLPSASEAVPSRISPKSMSPLPSQSLSHSSRMVLGAGVLADIAQVGWTPSAALFT